MTFLEAAIEILRHADEPLHFSDVARRAVDANLLSHVGRDPEAAMRSCLNSASRVGRDGQPPLIVRDKPGFYVLRPGAELPPPPEAGAAPEPEAPADEVEEEAAPTRRINGSSEHMDVKSKPRSRSGGRREAVEAEPVEAPARPAKPSVKEVEFMAPEGSGLEGVTDVALVMANAMSRLVEERPELRSELDAMQQVSIAAPEAPSRPSGPRPDDRDRDRDRGPNGGGEDRGGRRRRRRRRRGRRMEWSGVGSDPRPAAGGDRLLDDVAAVLEGAGARSLHIRQIAEQLAARNVLGGEISEIERAATAALLMDLHQHGRGSRFVARGDARYQLQGGRMPDRAAKTEAGLRDAVRDVEQETAAQLVQWLQSLGARGLESLVRIWLRREGHGLLSSLPPSRGIGRLITEDGEADDDDARQLVVVVPRRTPVDPKAWEGDAERHGCQTTVLFAMGEVGDEVGDVRVLGPSEFAAWLREQGIGITRWRLEVTVLDPTVIESVAGLDS